MTGIGHRSQGANISPIKGNVGQDRFGLQQVQQQAQTGANGQRNANKLLAQRIQQAQANNQMPQLVNAISKRMKNQGQVKVTPATLKNASDERLTRIVKNFK